MHLRAQARVPEIRCAVPVGDFGDAVQKSGADYVFISRYHPRDTLRDTAWQTGVRALASDAKAVHTSTQDGGSIVSSILLRVTPQ